MQRVVEADFAEAQQQAAALEEHRGLFEFAQAWQDRPAAAQDARRAPHAYASQI